MQYRIESSKAFSEVTFDLDPVVQRLGFVVLARQDIGELLRQHGGEFDEDYMVFSVCNYRLLDSLLCHGEMAARLPPKISVWTNHGSTWLACDQFESGGKTSGCSTQIEELNARLQQIITETR